MSQMTITWVFQKPKIVSGNSNQKCGFRDDAESTSVVGKDEQDIYGGIYFFMGKDEIGMYGELLFVTKFYGFMHILIELVCCFIIMSCLVFEI